MSEIAIIGGGLSGLTLGYRLTQVNGENWAADQLRIFEAKSTLGGRIPESPIDSKRHDAEFHFDLGPSWVWPATQPGITRLLDELDLSILPQWQAGSALFQFQESVPAQKFIENQAYDGAYRINGGSYTLIAALAERIPSECYSFDHALVELHDRDQCIELYFSHGQQNITVDANQVVLTLPPRLAAHTLRFTPVLSQKLVDVMNQVPTWMAGHAKVAVVYAHPFWREQGLSGLAIANYPGAPLAEVFDLCGTAGNPAILGGFIGLPASLRTIPHSELCERVIAQLVSLFGPSAAEPMNVCIKDWAFDTTTAVTQDHIPPSYHPEYGHPWFNLDHWTNKLFFSGTETEHLGGGYMEGAIQSAERIMGLLK